MKRKKISAAPQPQAEPQIPPAAQSLPKQMWSWDIVAVCLYSILLFVAMTVQTGRVTMLLMALALVLSVGKAPLRHLRERLCVPVLGLLVFALMSGLAGIYSNFGEYAVKETYKIFAALALALIVLLRFEKKHIRSLLWGFIAVCAVIALLCVDVGSARVLFGPFNGLMQAFGSDYSYLLEQEVINQLDGIYNDANLTGSLLGLAMLAALYLVHTEEKKALRFVGSVLLGVSAVSFFLAMSRGAILCFGMSLVVYLLLEKKEGRIGLFLLMVVSAIATVVVSAAAMPRLGTASLLPDLLTVAAGLFIGALDCFVAEPLSRRLAGHGKAMAAAVLAVALLAGGYLTAGMLVTGPGEINDIGYFARRVTLPAGEYNLTIESSGEVICAIDGQSVQDILMETYVPLYRENGEDAICFTVPEGTEQVQISFYGEPGTVLEQVEISHGMRVKLGYPLLPDFLVERMQGGLLKSSALISRVQFMKDGLALFAKSPVFGHGLGSTEGLLTSVQPFYYQTLYIHNHLIQIMDEMGLLGLAAFLAMMLGTAWLLIRRLRRDDSQLAPMLLACLVMMNLHGAMEISFSVRMFQCAAYFLVVLSVIYAAEPHKAPEKAVKWGGLAVMVCIWLYLAVFGALLESHRLVEQKAANFSTTDGRVFLNTVRDFAHRDVYDNEQYKLTFVGNTATLYDSSYNHDLRVFVKDLRASGTYTACSGLVRYYYLPRGEYEEMFACSREGIAQEASDKDAWNLQLEFYRTNVLSAMGPEDMSVYLDGVLQTKAYLEEYSQGRYEEIALTEENQGFLNAVVSIKEEEIPADVAYMYLQSLSEQ